MSGSRADDARVSQVVEKLKPLFDESKGPLSADEAEATGRRAEM